MRGHAAEVPVRHCAVGEVLQSFAGLLQWRLANLIVASLTTGALMAVLSSLQPDNVRTFAIPVSLLLGGSFAVGLLVGARLGLAAWWRRYLYAAGFSLRALGLADFSAVTLIAVIEVLRFLPLSSVDTSLRFMGVGGLSYSNTGRLLVFGMPLALFALGHLLCLLAHHPETNLPGLNYSRRSSSLPRRSLPGGRVGARLKGTGMSGDEEGARNILALRCHDLNDRLGYPLAGQGYGVRLTRRLRTQRETGGELTMDLLPLCG